jgi:hypothetical protein
VPLVLPWLLLARMGALNGLGDLQNDRAGLQQGLQVGDHLRPAARLQHDEIALRLQLRALAEVLFAIGWT